MQSHLTYVCRTRISRLGLRFGTILPLDLATFTNVSLLLSQIYHRHPSAGRFWCRRRGDHSETEDLSAVEFLVSSF